MEKANLILLDKLYESIWNNVCYEEFKRRSTMQEILYPSLTVFQLLRFPFLIYLGIFIIPLIVRWLKKQMHMEEFDDRNFKILYIMVVSALVLVFTSLFSGRFLYTIDVATQKTEIMEIVLPELSGNNTGIFFYKDGKQYRFYHNAEKTRNLEKNFVGYLCEIEYYKLSKSVARIRLLE